MCGRFTLRRADKLKLERLDTSGLFNVPPRYNIAPTQKILAVTETNEERSLSLLQWGLTPSWSRTHSGFINARAETLETKSSFKDSFHNRRCLIPADGFYEWEKLGKVKQPHYFQLKSSEPFFFAGIWDECRLAGVTITSCAIVTTRPNGLLENIHDRMPAILAPDDIDTWLRRNAKPAELRELLGPYPEGEMESYPVSERVNAAQVDDASLVDRIDPRDEVRNGLLF